jgi:asparagine synthase (glutamine-hydrolysing)
MDHYIEQVVDLTDAGANQIHNMDLATARECILRGAPQDVAKIDGSFALLARAGKTVRKARSMDRPMRYFLAKRQEGPALIVAHRIDAIHEWLVANDFADQFHPSYTRMVPAHHVVEIELVGCPDPDPVYTRFFTPTRNALPADLDEIGDAYIRALAAEIGKWLQTIPEREPIGVCFSGGIDSGAVFLTTYHLLRKLGLNPGRLKAFTLHAGGGPDLAQARSFLESLGLGLFLEEIDAAPSALDASQAIGIIEDYKPLDVECAVMGIALCRGIRERYTDWRHLIDGDGGDENLKDYPIEENRELTVRSVINNMMLYQEGWGVGKIKHSLVYSGGLSRSYTRTYAPASHFGFHGFSPFTRPNVIAVAEGIPFLSLTNYEVARLYSLKGEIVARGIKSVTGFSMPVFPKRRFQHGAVSREMLHSRVSRRETEYRKEFLARYS